MKSLIKRYLLEQNEILFAYLFGSFIQNKKYRAIDIAIYRESQLLFLELGLLQANLSDYTGMKVDLVSLNNRLQQLEHNISKLEKIGQNNSVAEIKMIL